MYPDGVYRILRDFEQAALSAGLAAASAFSLSCTEADFRMDQAVSSAPSISRSARAAARSAAA